MSILASLRSLRENAVASDFRVGLNFVITAQNYKEIFAAALLTKAAYAHYIRFEPEFYTALGHETIDEAEAEIENSLLKAKALEDKDFEVSVPKLNRGQMTKTDKIEGDFSKCHYSNFTTALGADGYMYPCPQVHLVSKYRMGNATLQGYAAWLERGEKNAWFKKNPDRRALCKTCFYRPPNELLAWLKNGKLDLEQVVQEYLADHPQTLHAEFI